MVAGSLSEGPFLKGRPYGAFWMEMDFFVATKR